VNLSLAPAATLRLSVPLLELSFHTLPPTDAGERSEDNPEDEELPELLPVLLPASWLSALLELLPLPERRLSALLVLLAVLPPLSILRAESELLPELPENILLTCESVLSD